MMKLNQSFAIVEGEAQEKADKITSLHAGLLQKSQQNQNLQEQI